MKEAWICPKCNVGVAPHCDTCPNCTNNLNLLGIPIKIDPSLPPNEWRLVPSKTIPSRPIITPPYTVTWDIAVGKDITVMFNPTAETANTLYHELRRKGINS